MKQYSILKSILSEPWAIQEEAAYALAPMVAGLFNQNLNLEFKPGIAIQPVAKVIQLKACDPTDDSCDDGGMASTMPSQNIQIITMMGTMTKQDQDCGPVGTVTIGKWIQEAIDDVRVDAIFFMICDCPGGSVAGTEELGNTCKNSTKPIVAFIDDCACSAAYWVASCCDEVIANNTTADVGSIGVLMNFMDIQPYYESLGVKFHSVTAPQSVDKTKMIDDVRAGRYDGLKTEVLQPLAQKFIDVVKSNRPEAAKDPNLFTGKSFFAQDVVGTLIDSIMPMDKALQHTAELASTSSTKTPSTSNQNPSTNMKLTRFAKAANLEAIMATADGIVNLTAEAAQAVESAIENIQTEAAAQSALLATAQESITANLTQADAQSALLATATARITELEAKVVELGGEAGADSAVVIPEADNNAITGKESVFSRMARVNEILNK